MVSNAMSTFVLNIILGVDVIIYKKIQIKLYLHYHYFQVFIFINSEGFA